MSKRYRSNYSLWPEQARPRRTISMTLAVGGFAIGIVCAVAAHSVVTDFLKPTAPPEVAVAHDDAIAQVPIYATAAAPAAFDSEPVSRSRARSVAKVTLPSIGTRGPLPSAETDGRGGGGDGRAGEAIAGGPNAAASAQAVAAAPIPTPAPESVAEIKPAEEPAAAANEPHKAKQKARVHRTTRTAKRKRARPSEYASGYRNAPSFGWGGGGYRSQPYYARQQYYGRYQYY